MWRTVFHEYPAEVQQILICIASEAVFLVVVWRRTHVIPLYHQGAVVVISCGNNNGLESVARYHSIVYISIALVLFFAIHSKRIIRGILFEFVKTIIGRNL